MLDIWLAVLDVSWSNSVELTRNIILSIASIVAMILGVKGLNAWKQEHVGKIEYDTARKMLKALYVVKDSIATVRDPVQWAGESDRAIRHRGKDPKDFDPIEDNHSIQCLVYARRWDLLSESLRQMKIDAFDAEILWGNDVDNSLKPLRERVSELSGAIHFYLRQQGPRARDVTVDQTEENEEILWRDYPSPSGDANRFDMKINDAVEVCEGFIKPHLIKHLKK
jgi:hypothetical protein